MSFAARRFLSVVLAVAILGWLGETSLSAVLDDLPRSSRTAWCESLDPASPERSNPRPATPFLPVAAASTGTANVVRLRITRQFSGSLAERERVHQVPRAPPA